MAVIEIIHEMDSFWYHIWQLNSNFIENLMIIVYHVDE